MNHFFIFLTFLICFFPQSSFAFGLTADQMYRNLLEGENKGALPSYYAARAPRAQQPPRNPSLPFKKAEKDKDVEKIWQPEGLTGSPMTKEDSEAFNSYKVTKSWKDVVISVQRGQMTPFEFQIVKTKSEQSDPEATELLAWMYATGTGISRNLTQSFIYYRQAAHLGVPKASENAKAVYTVMKASERAQLPNI